MIIVTLLRMWSTWWAEGDGGGDGGDAIKASQTANLEVVT